MAKKEWALILGASSGFGEAVGLRLAKAGFNIFGVHMDRKQGLANVERIVAEMGKCGVKAQFFNANAAAPDNRKMVVDEMKKSFAGAPNQRLRVVLHSLAFGTLKNFIHDDAKEELQPAQVEMTLNVMASSLIYWAQDLNHGGLLTEGSQIYAMTSAGGSRVWPTYGAVSAAKAALESNIRQLSLELASKGVSANAILAGVTDTPALRKIPGHENMIETASSRNPFKRLTTTQDIAELIACLANGLTNSWMTGNVIRVDGGENIVD